MSHFAALLNIYLYDKLYEFTNSFFSIKSFTSIRYRSEYYKNCYEFRECQSATGKIVYLIYVVKGKFFAVFRGKFCVGSLA